MSILLKSSVLKLHMIYIPVRGYYGTEHWNSQNIEILQQNNLTRASVLSFSL